MKRSFPDFNVWFALAVADHPHHRSARAWWSEESSLAEFCQLTQLGLLRLLTTASAIGGRPLSNAEAWGVYDGFVSVIVCGCSPNCRHSTITFELFRSRAAAFGEGLAR